MKTFSKATLQQIYFLFASGFELDAVIVSGDYVNKKKRELRR